MEPKERTSWLIAGLLSLDVLAQALLQPGLRRDRGDGVDVPAVVDRDIAEGLVVDESMQTCGSDHAAAAIALSSFAGRKPG